jgi:hypothetical protein
MRPSDQDSLEILNGLVSSLEFDDSSPESDDQLSVVERDQDGNFFLIDENNEKIPVLVEFDSNFRPFIINAEGEHEYVNVKTTSTLDAMYGLTQDYDVDGELSPIQSLDTTPVNVDELYDPGAGSPESDPVTSQGAVSTLSSYSQEITKEIALSNTRPTKEMIATTADSIESSLERIAQQLDDGSNPVAAERFLSRSKCIIAQAKQEAEAAKTISELDGIRDRIFAGENNSHIETVKDRLEADPSTSNFEQVLGEHVYSIPDLITAANTLMSSREKKKQQMLETIKNEQSIDDTQSEIDTATEFAVGDTSAYDDERRISEMLDVA